MSKQWEPEFDPQWPEDGWVLVAAVIVLILMLVLFSTYGGQ